MAWPEPVKPTVVPREQENEVSICSVSKKIDQKQSTFHSRE